MTLSVGWHDSIQYFLDPRPYQQQHRLYSLQQPQPVVDHLDRAPLILFLEFAGIAPYPGRI